MEIIFWEVDYMINFRTDLALERRDLFKKANNISNEVDGLETQEESFTDDIKISRVKVLNDNGEQAIGKRKGTYITIDIKNLKIAGEDRNTKSIRSSNKGIKKSNWSFSRSTRRYISSWTRKFICNARCIRP